ncbi:MAG: hypothetical protein GY763_06265 [Gammaproteobacteria bacterium]|nr:hypothetical protein [Gammaproteobacteria bacterium]
MAATERIPVLMTPVEKRRVVAKAKKAGLKTSEFMRLAASNYHPNDDEKAFEAMITHMNKVTANTSRVIDKALAKVEASNKRIAKMEARASKA